MLGLGLLLVYSSFLFTLFESEIQVNVYKLYIRRNNEQIYWKSWKSIKLISNKSFRFYLFIHIFIFFFFWKYNLKNWFSKRLLNTKIWALITMCTMTGTAQFVYKKYKRKKNTNFMFYLFPLLPARHLMLILFTMIFWFHFMTIKNIFAAFVLLFYIF